MSDTKQKTPPRTRTASLGSIFGEDEPARVGAESPNVPRESVLARLSPEDRDILGSAQDAIKALGADATPNHPVVKMHNKLLAKLLQPDGEGSGVTRLADDAPTLKVSNPDTAMARKVSIVAPTVSIVAASASGTPTSPRDVEASTPAVSPEVVTFDSTIQAEDAAPEALAAPETPGVSTADATLVTPSTTQAPVTPLTPASEAPMSSAMSVVTSAESVADAGSGSPAVKTEELEKSPVVSAEESKTASDGSSQRRLLTAAALSDGLFVEAPSSPATLSSSPAPVQSHDVTAAPDEESAPRPKRRSSEHLTRCSSISQDTTVKDWDGSKQQKTRLARSKLNVHRSSVSAGIDRRSLRKLETHFVNDGDGHPMKETRFQDESEADWTQRRVEASRRASMIHQDKVHRRLSTLSGGPRESVMSASSFGRRSSLRAGNKSRGRRASSVRALGEKVQRRRSVGYDAGECYTTRSQALRSPDIIHEPEQVPRGEYELTLQELQTLCSDTYEALFISDGAPLRNKVVGSSRDKIRGKMMNTCDEFLSVAVKTAMAAAVSPELDDVLSHHVTNLADNILDCLAKSKGANAQPVHLQPHFAIDNDSSKPLRARPFPITDEESFATEDAIMAIIREKAAKVNQVLDDRRLPLLMTNMQKLSVSATRYELVVDTMGYVLAGASPKPLEVDDPSVLSYALVDNPVREKASTQQRRWIHRFIALKIGKTHIRNPENHRRWRVVVKTLKHHVEDEEHKRNLALDHAYKNAQWWNKLNLVHNPMRSIQSRPRRRMSVEERDLFEILSPLIVDGAPPNQTEWAQGALDYEITRNWKLNTWLGPKTPLRACVYHKRLPLVETLLKGRADANEASEPAGVSVLHLAAWAGSVQVAELLLNHGANPNQPDALGQTPIFFALNVETCQLLVQHRADLLHSNERDQSPLHLASRAGQEPIMRWMMEREPSLQAKKDVYGAHPVYYARQAGMDDEKPIVGEMKNGKFQDYF